MSDCIDHGQVGNNRGYGHTRLNKREIGLHRKVWQDANGPIPDGFVVMHSCDNPRCINIEHLSVGTHSDNLMDASRKGRLADRPTPAGEKNSHAKLTEYSVRWIRSLWATGDFTQVELGKMFGVGGSNVSHIVNRVSWSHLD